MNKDELYSRRRERFMKAVHHEKPDRTPIFLHMANVPMMKYVDPTKTVADFIENPYECIDLIAEGYERLPEIDSFSISAPPYENTGIYWFAKTKLPGRDLGRDETWQLDEKAPMTLEDYDTVLDKGWSYMVPILEERAGLSRKDDEKMYPIMAYCQKKNEELRPFNICDGWGPLTLDYLSAARGLTNFYRDLRKIPDKVEAVANIILEESLQSLEEQLKAYQGEEPPWILLAPATRCANCDFVSAKVFERFAWPSFKKQADLVFKYGGYIDFHMDCKWDDFLEFFTDFPKNRVLFDSDGLTDIKKLYEVLGDRFCLTGDISSSLMSLGTPEEVYRYGRELKDMIGDGFVMNGACVLPVNTKPENIDALVRAAID